MIVRVAWGPTDTPVRVGFTKKPRQLAARASVARAAKAPIRRRFDFGENMI